MTIRVISHGGGVQTTALVALAATGNLDDVMGGPVTHALFANVGDDSENPETITYVRNVMAPYAADHGIELVELTRPHPDHPDRPITLLEDITRLPSSIPIPVRMANGAPGNRPCTTNYKVRTVARWTRQHGATPDDPAIVAIGFSTDEIERVGRYPHKIRHQTIRYPLIDLDIDRAECHQIITRAGLPTPPKSACWFCPFHTLTDWAEMRRDHPDRFAAAAALEARINQTRRDLDRDDVYLTRRGVPIDQAITAADPTLFPPDVWDGGCETGHCFT